MENNGEESISQSLPDDVIEMILSLHSISDLPKSALVCKQWRSLIASSLIRRDLPHSLHKCKPWLFILGANKRRGSGFDPLARRWIRLPPLSLNPQEQDAILMEGNGILFSVAGGRLKFTKSFLNPRKWEQCASAVRVWRRNPLVCQDQGKIAVIGGVHELEEDKLNVEMLHLESGECEMCDPLPEEFRHSASSMWLSAAVFNGKIYVLEKFKGDFCSFDLQDKRWEKLMSVAGSLSSISCKFVKYFCLACKGGLVLAGLIRDDGGLSFRMRIVEDLKLESKEGKEIRMPGEMLKFITCRETGEEEEEEEEEEDEWSSLSEHIECRGLGDLVYVFNKSRYLSRNRVCLFDFSTGIWEILADNNGGLCMDFRNRDLWICSAVRLDETWLASKS